MIYKYSDREIIEGLRQRKSSCVNFLYQEFYPIIRNYLEHNSGNRQDMEDLIHDTIIVLFERVMDPQFVLYCSLKTYFISISRHLWLQKLERQYRLLYQADYQVHEEKESYVLDDLERSEESLEEQRLFYKNLMLLPVDCMRLLQLYCLKISYKEIVSLMKYRDEDYVKTRKYLCKKMLRRKILNDPEYRQFLRYEKKRNFK